MPAGRLYRIPRNYEKNSAAKKLQRFIRKRRSAGAQSVQLAKTNNRIDLINGKLRKNVNKYGMYHEVSSIAVGPYQVVMLQPALTAGAVSQAWSNCFANSTAAINCNRVRLGKCYIHLQFTCFTEPSPITYSVFHVRLQPKNSLHMVETFGTNLAGLSSPGYFIRGANALIAYTANTEGMIMLNPDFFIIKKKWVFTLTDSQVAIGSAQTTNARSTYKNIEYSFPLNYTLGVGTGSWTSVSADQDTDSKLKNYLLIFTNNATGDLENNSMSCLAQVTATGLE